MKCNNSTFLSFLLICLSVFLLMFSYVSQASEAEKQTYNSSESSNAVAKKLNNPVSNLISVPVQFNFDTNIGPEDDGDRHQINFQPVAPFQLNDNWNVISRTILPVIFQDDIFPGAGSQQGLGDILQSFFFSPTSLEDNGLIWGAGPAFLFPSGTDELLTTNHWGVGPTAVALRQSGPWTIGVLANHIFTYAGDSSREDINQTYFQPFINYTTDKALTFALNTEGVYDHKAKDASIPVNLMTNQVLNIGGQTLSIGGGLRYWVDQGNNGPEGLGFRFNFVLIFPK